MAFTKITPADTTGKGVIGLPDTPELSSTDMQEKFDELALDVIVPKFNNLVDEITDAFVEEGGDIADVAQALTDEVSRAQGAEGDLSDAITTLDGAVMKKATYDSDNDGVVDNSELLNGHADSYFATAQSVSDLTTTVNGKMTRSTYDADNDGVVDNAEALGGHGASYFATASALSDVISSLTNYYTKSQTYSQSEVNALVSAYAFGGFIAVNSLPTTDIKTNAIYLVPSADPQTKNVKDEYINTTGTSAGWEKIGSTDIDLLGYVTTEQFNTALANYSTTSQMNAAINAAVSAKTEIDDTTTSATKTWSSNKISSELTDIEQNAEAWAVGQRNGEDVPPTDETYHNNAKYYSQAAYSAKTDAETANTAAQDALDEIESVIGVTFFHVDFTTGNLVYNDPSSYTFTINTTTGNLEWEVA